ncbi:GH25 family lysozyme [Cribrihabitans sp. XS_ASV171]
MRRLLLIALCLLAAACGRREPASDLPSVQAASAGAAVLSSLVTYPDFDDADPHSWDGRGPDSYPIHGIDISRWQGEIDWPRARDAGVSFAFIKATEGGDRLDPKFDEYRRGAGRAGVPWSAYHFFYFCRPAAEQARWFIRNVPRGADLPHVLDMEWNPFSPTCTKRPPGETVRAEAEIFLDLLEAHYGRRPIIYTTIDFYRETGIGRLRGTEFWLRSVAGHPRQVYPGAFWTFWQYSGTGLVPGIEGKVDLNVFHDSPEIWLRWKAGQISRR